MRELIVLEDCNLRLDKYLMDKVKYSRNKIQRLIKDQKVLVNDLIVKSNYVVKKNDCILMFDEEIKKEIKPEKIKLNIIYEDDDLLVINKPSGMVVHPAPGIYAKTLVNALLDHCSNLSMINGEVRPGIVHRLDKETSGLLIVAKNNKTHLALINQFKSNKVKRHYLALVHGIIEHEKGTIEAPIKRDNIDRRKMMVSSLQAKEAITHFKVLERFKNKTLIECQLVTGRTHQIRVHLKYINHPLVNDPLYGKENVCLGFGQMLHAKLLGFYHPKTNKYLEFVVEPPAIFQEIVDKYQKEVNYE
ncbi:MAG: RluA family pseudouridine synthase [Bacilli bacterium]|jgi:23S rRNA pseudouridine1911/1915/1917 synthase